jgi:hypothetical protein
MPSRTPAAHVHGLDRNRQGAHEELFDKSVIAGHGPVDWLCGQLWNCADLLSSALRAELDHAVNTYGQAARLIHAGRQG